MDHIVSIQSMNKFHVIIKLTSFANYLTSEHMLPEFYGFEVKDVEKQVACVYQRNQSHRLL